MFKLKRCHCGIHAFLWSSLICILRLATNQTTWHFNTDVSHECTWRHLLKIVRSTSEWESRQWGLLFCFSFLENTFNIPGWMFQRPENHTALGDFSTAQYLGEVKSKTGCIFPSPESLWLRGAPAQVSSWWRTELVTGCYVSRLKPA